MSEAVAIPASQRRKEHPNDRVRRLAAEIRRALNEPTYVGATHIIIDRDRVSYVERED